MRKPFLLAALLLPAGASSLAAQTTYYARLGAIGASRVTAAQPPAAPLRFQPAT